MTLRQFVRIGFAFALSVMMAAGTALAGSSNLLMNVGTVDTQALVNLKTDSPATFERGKSYVVQLDGPITPAIRASLQQKGIVLGDYLPDNAYVVELGGVAPATLKTIDSIQWVGAFANEWKLSPELGRRAFLTQKRQELAGAGQSRVAITLFQGKAPGAVTRAISRVPGATINEVTDVGGNQVLSVTLASNDVAGLAQLDDVQYIEDAPEITFRNGTSRWIVQSNVTNVTPLYNNGIHGEGQVVGIMDGKVNVSHCSFRDTVNPIGPLHRKILAYNTTQGYDVHGTHVAGTAVGDNGVDDNTRGIAYLGKLVFEDIPSFSESGMRNALIQHHNQGARAHTNSWGDDGTTSYNALCRGVDSFSYDFEDSLVLFAVTNTSTLKNPENAKNLLAVGASQDTPNQGNHCSGGQGPTVDGRRKPEIYAPGCSTNSSTGSGTSCSTTQLTGTSMASPAVAGTALLVRQYYTDGYYPSGTANSLDAMNPSGALVKATLLNSSVDMTGVAGYPSAREGWGRVLADYALFFAGDTRRLGVLADIRNANGMSTGMEQAFNLTVTSSAEQLRVTLVWVDPPAAASTGSGAAEVNNLNLEVVAPDNTVYKGNVFSGGVSISGGTADAENNVEQVHLNSPATGGWIVRVKATSVAVGLQGFALVATGNVLLAPPDCNENGVPDADDILLGTSEDCNENAKPDECEDQSDCNENGELDFCDLYTGHSVDCNTNDIPDDCELEGNDCNHNAIPDGCESSTDCNGNSIQDFCDIANGTVEDCNANGVPDVCEFSAPIPFYSADFEGGLPSGWTTSSLWHISTVCPRASSCDGSSWTYFGYDATCDFNNGALRVDGTLQMPAINLPTGTTGLTLSYCSAYAGEAGNSNTSGNDWAWVSVNGIEWDDVSLDGNQADWETREVDLLPFAGQTVTIRFRFDSRNGTLNSTLGWQVDKVVLSAIYEGVNDCNSNLALDSCEIETGQTADCNRNGLPDDCETSVICQCEGTVRGDVSGDNLVSGPDVQKFTDCYMGGNVNAPGCPCADMNASGTFESTDIGMFVDCELGISCP